MADEVAAVVVTAAEITACDVAAVISEGVENAKNRAEHAEEINAAIIEAAIEGERADRVAAVEMELVECRTSITSQAETLAQIQTELLNLSNLCRESAGDRAEIREAMAEMRQASIPPILTAEPEPEPAIIPATIEAKPEAKKEEDAPAPKKRHRFL